RALALFVEDATREFTRILSAQYARRWLRFVDRVGPALLVEFRRVDAEDPNALLSDGERVAVANVGNRPGYCVGWGWRRDECQQNEDGAFVLRQGDLRDSEL